MKILLYDEYLPRFRLPAENYYIIKKDKNATTSAHDIAARTAHAPIKLNISREIFRADVCVCVYGLDPSFWLTLFDSSTKDRSKVTIE